MTTTLGPRKFVEISGDRTHELPPLLLPAAHGRLRAEKAVELASQLVEQDEMLPLPAVETPENGQMRESRKLDLALQLVSQYQGFIASWQTGQGILEWIRQCEITFETRLELRPLLRPDLWPHAGRSSFVTLLRDKSVSIEGVEAEEAVGLRLAFRQPPPLKCCSDQFLFYLKTNLASSAYETWAKLSPDPVSSLPPERFAFHVHRM